MKQYDITPDFQPAPDDHSGFESNPGITSEPSELLGLPRVAGRNCLDNVYDGSGWPEASLPLKVEPIIEDASARKAADYLIKTDVSPADVAAFVQGRREYKKGEKPGEVR